jgi:hypothetical protein
MLSWLKDSCQLIESAEDQLNPLPYDSQLLIIHALNKKKARFESGQKILSSLSSVS